MIDTSAFCMYRLSAGILLLTGLYQVYELLPEKEHSIVNSLKDENSRLSARTDVLGPTREANGVNMWEERRSTNFNG